MILYALTIFTSAFLLFLVQPIMAKQILPWFGGSAAVWTTCLVFFQFLLLAGYAYSDWTTRRLAARRQVVLHVVLLARASPRSPSFPTRGWKPAGGEDPTWRILGLLAVTIGLPYFLLSTTGPLVQAWFARTFPAGTVYRLFALSNFGSLLALVSYPFAVEPWITTAAPVVGLERRVMWCSPRCAPPRPSTACAGGKRSRCRRTATDGAGREPAPRPRDYAAVAAALRAWAHSCCSR